MTEMNRCRRSRATERDACPACKRVGRPVGDVTVRAMLAHEQAERLLSLEIRFCRTPSCEVVYYGADGRVARKQDIRVRVGLKETEAPIPLCYCFGFSRADVEREVAQTGSCTIARQIAAEIRAGRCACEVKNPSGACCLGDVRAAVAEMMAPASPPRLRRRLAADSG